MKALEMDVYMDRVLVEHQEIKRPDHITRSVWIEIWESIKHTKCPNCGKRLWNG